MGNIVLEYAYSYDISIERNVKVSQWNNGRESGTLFIGSMDSTVLKHVRWTDLSDMGIWTRQSDGCFAGYGNMAWFITEAEADALIALNEERAAKIKAEEEANEAAEAEYERNRQAILKMMDDDAEPYC